MAKWSAKPSLTQILTWRACQTCHGPRDYLGISTLKGWTLIQMVRSYRSRDDIIVDILEAAVNRVKKTHIMQRANLNPLMFRKYFPTLLRNGWIVEQDDPDGGSLYGLSADGKVLLKMYRVLRAKFRKKPDVNAIQTW